MSDAEDHAKRRRELAEAREEAIERRKAEGASTKRKAAIAGAVALVTIGVVGGVSYSRDLAQRREEAGKVQATVDAFRKGLAGVDRAVAALDSNTDDIPCADDAVAKAGGATRRIRLQMIDAADLHLLTESKELPSRPAFEWTTTDRIRRLELGADPMSEELRKTSVFIDELDHASGSLVAVLKVATLKMPKISPVAPDAPLDAQRTFEGGKLEARIILYDMKTSTRLCQSGIEAWSSDAVDYRKRLLSEGNADEKLRDDFVTQARAAARQAIVDMSPRLALDD